MITGEIFKMLALRKKMKISLNPVTEIIAGFWFSLHICIHFNLQSQWVQNAALVFPQWEPSTYPTSPPPPSHPTGMSEVSALGPHNSSPSTVLSGGCRWVMNTPLCGRPPSTLCFLKVSPASPHYMEPHFPSKRCPRVPPCYSMPFWMHWHRNPSSVPKYFRAGRSQLCPLGTSQHLGELVGIIPPAFPVGLGKPLIH